MVALHSGCEAVRLLQLRSLRAVCRTPLVRYADCQYPAGRAAVTIQLVKLQSPRTDESHTASYTFWLEEHRRPRLRSEVEMTGERVFACLLGSEEGARCGVMAGRDGIPLALSAMVPRRSGS